MLIDELDNKSLEEAFQLTSENFEINYSDREAARNLVLIAFEDFLQNNILIKTGH